jgi:hypothetical protein
MGHVFKAEMELLTKEMLKDQDGQAIDLILFKVAARKCALQLLELVSANKSTAGRAGPSLWTQTQAPRFFLLPSCNLIVWLKQLPFLRPFDCNEFHAGKFASFSLFNCDVPGF